MGYKTFEDMKHNIPEGATHYRNECKSFLFTWFKETDSGIKFYEKASQNWSLIGRHVNNIKSKIVKIPSQIETPEEKEALDMIDTTSKQVDILCSHYIILDIDTRKDIGIHKSSTPIKIIGSDYKATIANSYLHNINLDDFIDGDINLLMWCGVEFFNCESLPKKSNMFSCIINGVDQESYFNGINNSCLDDGFPLDRTDLKKCDVVEWNDEDLPPVGVECSFTPDNTMWGFNYIEEFTGTVLHYEGEQFVFMLNHDKYKLDSGMIVVSRTDKGEFSKPESQEQKAERERLESAYDLCTTVYPDFSGFDEFKKATTTVNLWLAIVDKTGYRKQ